MLFPSEFFKTQDLLNRIVAVVCVRMLGVFLSYEQQDYKSAVRGEPENGPV